MIFDSTDLVPFSCGCLENEKEPVFETSGSLAIVETENELFPGLNEKTELDCDEPKREVLDSLVLLETKPAPTSETCADSVVPNSFALAEYSSLPGISFTGYPSFIGILL